MDGSLVGRDRELAELRRLAGAAAAGSGALLVLSGEPGIGKSSLLAQWLAEATAAGAVTLLGRAVADEGVPATWPWREVLESAARAGIPGLGPQLLDVTDAAAANADAAGERFRVLDRAARALVDAASTTTSGLVVGLEDLQWADEGTVRLLAHLVRYAGTARLLLVATVRDGPGRPELEQLLADPAVRVLRLEPLSRTDVAAVLATGPDRASGLDDRTVDLLHRRSGGNPLYLTELARLPADGSIGVDDDAPLPERLRRLVARRVAMLSPACREVVGACAAIGDDVDLALLAEVAGPPGEILAAVDEAVDHGVLRDEADRPGRLRFSHEVLRMGCYDALPRAERVRWHRLLADAIDRPDLPDSRAGELARHRCRSAVDEGSVRLALGACVRAGRVTQRTLALEESVQWWTTALELLDRVPLAGTVADPDTSVDRAGVLVELAEACYRVGRVDDALEHCREAVAAAEAQGRPDLAAAAALVVRGIGGPPAGAVAELCERARALLGEEASARRARVLAQHAVALTELGLIGEAEPLAAEALALAERLDDAHALVDALWANHDVAHGPDAAAQRLALGRRLGALARLVDRPDAVMWACLWRVEAQLQLGDLSRLDQEQDQLERLADELGWPLVRWHALRLRACRALLAGRFAECRQLIRDLEHVASQLPGSAGFMVMAFDAELAWRTGGPDPFPKPDTQLPPEPIAMAMYGLWQQELGDRETAALMHARLRPHLADLPVDTRWLPTMVCAGELAAALDDPATAAQCLELLRPYADQFVNALAGVHGSVRRTLGVLEAATGDPDAGVAQLRAAVAAESAMGALPDEARGLLELARVLERRRAAGDADAALDAARAALRLARRLGMRPVSDRAAALVERLQAAAADSGATLTGREREIVGLLAAGLANREIAARLVLSERTVESHVRNVLSKLGFDNRTQVASWAHRAGLATTVAGGRH